MISQFEKIKSQIEHGELLPMQVFEMMLEARGSAEPVGYGLKYESGEYSCIIEATREPWLRRGCNGEINVLYECTPAPAAAVPDAIDPSADGGYYDDCYINGWNACRAAMLSAAPTPPSSEQSNGISNDLENFICYLIDKEEGGVIAEETLHSQIANFLESDHYKLPPTPLEQPDSAAPNEWNYCPECGSKEIHYEEGVHKQCKNCYQEWFSDIDYSDVVRKHLGEWYLQASAKPQRITEQDAREIAFLVLDYKTQFSTERCVRDAKTFSQSPSMGSLLAKLNEHREPDYKARADELLETGKAFLGIWDDVYPDIESGKYPREALEHFEFNQAMKFRAAIAKHGGGK